MKCDVCTRRADRERRNNNQLRSASDLVIRCIFVIVGVVAIISSVILWSLGRHNGIGFVTDIMSITVSYSGLISIAAGLKK